MNDKVEKYINDVKKKHLISSGIIDSTKTVIQYHSTKVPGAQFDHGKQMYYTSVPTALEVTDEEFAEICKYDIQVIKATIKTLENTINENYIDQSNLATSIAKNLKTIKNIIVAFTALYVVSVIVGIIIFFA